MASPESILEEINADDETRTAFSELEALTEGRTTASEVERERGRECREIVELASSALIEKAGKGNREAAARKLLLATSRDTRATAIVLLFIAKRIVQEKDKGLAEMGLLVYGPIAHKLGMGTIKGYLEDTAFKVISPEEYKRIGEEIQEKRKEREENAGRMADELGRRLGEAGIRHRIFSRAKHFYSISSKMKRKGILFGEINERTFDLTAVRVIVEEKKDCYSALGIAHEMWRPLQSEFEDYIAKPKPNSYQSLHTVVIGPGGRPMEIQIRTKEMNDIAEAGVAAHWKYKKEPSFRKETEKKLAWIKEALESAESGGMISESLKMDFFENEIVVFTPKGQPVELPEGSTPIDFAYAIHSGLGASCAKARANGRLVPLDYELKNGETIEIVVSEEQKPKASWLSFVKTRKASSKIRSALKIHRRLQKEKKSTGILTVSGAEEKMRLAKCCSPIPGDEIICIRTTKRKLSVHRADCQNALLAPEHKKKGVGWGKTQKAFSTSIRLNAVERPGLLSDILAEFQKAGQKAVSGSAKTVHGNQLECSFQVEAKSLAQLEETMRKLRGIKSVQSAERA